MRTTSFVSFASLVWLSLGASVARADAPGVYAESLPPERVGLELGVGLQGGRIFCEGQMGQCDGFTEAGGGNVSAAYFLSPTLGIAVDLWAMAHTDDGFTFAHYVNTVALKWRPMPILTLTAGIGEAHASLDYDGVAQFGVRSDDAFAILGAASLDLIRGNRWALSVEARFGNGFYGDDDNDGMADVVGRSVGVGAGLSIFGF
ncbi:MAG: hypothetical protein HOV81_23235 [Kofleriaceae bacterium]|nr:hypothetical protein [Kofleriaceae bacterium]